MKMVTAEVLDDFNINDNITTIEEDNKHSLLSENAILKILKENRIFGEYNQGENDKCFSIDINWGDWKHDHLWCDRVMASYGYSCYNEEITEENGSDTYSSIHYYEFMN